MADLETNMRIDYKYSVLSKQKYIQLQHELTLLPKEVIKKIIEDNNYEVNDKDIARYQNNREKYGRIDYEQLKKDIMNANLNIQDIIDKHKIRRQQVYGYISSLRKQGYKIPKRRKTSKENLYLKDILKLKEEGYSFAQIAVMLDIGLSTVQHYYYKNKNKGVTT